MTDTNPTPETSTMLWPDLPAGFLVTLRVQCPNCGYAMKWEARTKPRDFETMYADFRGRHADRQCRHHALPAALPVASPVAESGAEPSSGLAQAAAVAAAAWKPARPPQRKSDDHTTGTLARELSEAGYRTPNGRPIQAWMIRRMFETGQVPESARRYGLFRTIPVESVPVFKAALRKAGYLTDPVNRSA